MSWFNSDLRDSDIGALVIPFDGLKKTTNSEGPLEVLSKFFQEKPHVEFSRFFQPEDVVSEYNSNPDQYVVHVTLPEYLRNPELTKKGLARSMRKMNNLNQIIILSDSGNNKPDLLERVKDSIYIAFQKEIERVSEYLHETPSLNANDRQAIENYKVMLEYVQSNVKFERNINFETQIFHDLDQVLTIDNAQPPSGKGPKWAYKAFHDFVITVPDNSQSLSLLIARKNLTPDRYVRFSYLAGKHHPSIK